MTLYFRDTTGALRAIETEWHREVLDRQRNLVASIRAATGIVPSSAVVAVVS